MQLVAYGAQDIYLTGNPQITFFKVVYRRHTNFSCESIQQTLNGSVGYNKKVSATISRNGDLVHRCYLVLTATNADANDKFGAVAHQMIKEVSVEIGGQEIDKHYGSWISMWLSLTSNKDKAKMLNSMGTQVVAANTKSNNLYLPLQFWFCRNPGLALPLIALQYHEVKFHIAFNPGLKSDDRSTSAVQSTAMTCELWCDYIYLDTDERRRFAQVSHEYLIEQVQSDRFKTASTSHELNFNHPVKALYWTKESAFDANAGNTDGGGVKLEAPGAGKTNLKLNGHDRMAQREERYFTEVQRYQHHSGCGDTFINSITDAQGTEQKNNLEGAIAVYSFALEPEEHQPSGTCNFSRIDNAHLKLSASVQVSVYAVNYNVLRIMSGMGGLAYSN